MDALGAAARLRAGAPSGAAAGAPGADLGTAVDQASLDSVFNVLRQYSEALGKLQVGAGGQGGCARPGRGARLGEGAGGSAWVGASSRVWE